jgi:cytochrome c553
MRVLTIVFGLLLFAPVAAQAPPPRAPSRQSATRPSSDAVLAELMRGIMFPNANIIFDVTTNDPGVEKKLGEAGGGALATFANIYTGWEVVKNAALVLEEAPDLILKPGRLCANGRPVPLQRADFRNAAQNLREVAKKIVVAARAQERQKFDDLTSDLVDACVRCHQVYRTAPPEHPRRCIPGPPPR